MSKNAENPCPYCDNDRTSGDDPLYDALIGHPFSYTHNPGGMYITFADGSGVQIGNQCPHCDARKVREFLGTEDK